MTKKSIVIGAGACGLLASLKLINAGHATDVLEARNSVGGRICTLKHKGFSTPLHLGAEFVHGQPARTISLLKQASIGYHEITGRSYEIEGGRVSASGLFDAALGQLLPFMHVLEGDLVFAEFIQQKFPGNAKRADKDKIVRFVEGYHAADILKVSTKALAREWAQEEDPKQFRPYRGYGGLMDHLSKAFIQQGGHLHLSRHIKSIRWKKGRVEAIAGNGETFHGRQCLITVPLGALQQNSIEIDPPLPLYRDAASRIGFGSVIKFFVEFDQSFWTTRILDLMPDLSFLFSDAPVPTWWSQLPESNPVLTGWLGGPAAVNISGDREAQETQAVESLAYAFQCTTSFIRSHVKAIEIKDWRDDALTAGAYSFATPESPYARRVLNTPVEDTLFFAGEALDEGPRTGTVEAALCSAEQVVEKMIHALPLP